MEDDSLGAIGFMFDLHHQKIELPIELHNGIQILLKVIGTDPGHKQSGQYLWPAATELANHLIDDWNVLHTNEVLELGAGCGLSGITAEILGAEVVYFTDYDAGAIDLIIDNIRSNCRNEANCQAIQYTWGTATSIIRTKKFDLIIGADLLYCVEVVEPLLATVQSILSEEGLFILCTSFHVGEEINAELLAQINSKGLNCVEVTPLGQSTSKIQYFSFRCRS